MSPSNSWDVIVIGGGAAGLWAAGTAAQRGRKVLVLEKNNKPGVKILMSGGTRCNITQACDVSFLLQAFGSQQARFLKHAVHELPPAQVVHEFNSWGVATKVEDTGKVFPVSDRALDVRDALLNRLTTAGATLRSGVTVLDVSQTDHAQLPERGPYWTVRVTDAELTAEKILLCCGGLSYAACGTTGDGYDWARRAGHSLAKTSPALTPLLSPVKWVHELQGITVPDAETRVLLKGKRQPDPRTISRGGFLWTHFGCSGPAPMNVSRFISELDSPHMASLQVDLVPETPEEEIAAAMQNACGGKRRVINVVQSWTPRNLAHSLVLQAGISDSTTLAELPKKARQALISNLKRLSIPLSGTRGYAKAEVTRGGVITREVNPRTLESRLAPGLFFAGEILDIDGPIGGYNFQAAFSTGHLAALNM